MKLSVAIPGLRLSSTLNDRRHWRKRAGSAKAQRLLANLHLSRFPKPTGPVVVTITRVSPRQLDSDNLAGACKSVRDGVADWLGVDDGVAERAGLVLWQCAQEVKAKTYEVRILIEAKA